MLDQYLSIAAGLTGIVLGVMNFMKHRQLARDMKNFPLHISLELSFGEDFEPRVTVQSVTRAKSADYPSGRAEPGR